MFYCSSFRALSGGIQLGAASPPLSIVNVVAKTYRMAGPRAITQLPGKIYLNGSSDSDSIWLLHLYKSVQGSVGLVGYASNSSGGMSGFWGVICGTLTASSSLAKLEVFEQIFSFLSAIAAAWLYAIISVLPSAALRVSGIASESALRLST